MCDRARAAAFDLELFRQRAERILDIRKIIERFAVVKIVIRRGRIVLVSPAVGSIPVTAVFNTHETGQALRTIGQTLPVRIFHATGYVVLIVAA